MKNYTLYALRYTLIIALLFGACGCDAFVRKFTRKSKKAENPEEMVIEPQEYKPTMTKEELYRQYYMFWKSFQEDLISAFMDKRPQKKNKYCVQQALKNLNGMYAMLTPVRQEKLKPYLDRMNGLSESISKDIYGYSSDALRRDAEGLKRDIMQYFGYPDVKNDLI